MICSKRGLFQPRRTHRMMIKNTPFVCTYESVTESKLPELKYTWYPTSSRGSRCTLPDECRVEVGLAVRRADKGVLRSFFETLHLFRTEKQNYKGGYIKSARVDGRKVIWENVKNKNKKQTKRNERASASEATTTTADGIASQITKQNDIIPPSLQAANRLCDPGRSQFTFV